MNITTFTVGGPSLDARIPLPQPTTIPVKPYPLNEFMTDMRKCLASFAQNDAYELTHGDMGSRLAEDGTCYWIRADMDDGTRFMRVYLASHDDETGEIDLDIASCDQAECPGMLRLN